MAKIINVPKLKQEITAIKKSGQSIVLAGGCFDILHVGHIKFLKEAKKSGDLLFVLLESDKTVTRLKGSNRPYFTQKDRAEVLSSIKYIDYVVMMDPINSDEEYIGLTLLIHPEVIAITADDPLLTKKKNQAEMVGGNIKTVPFLKTYSSSKLAILLGIE